MSEIITQSKLSKTLCTTFQNRVDELLAQFDYLLPSGWQLSLEHVTEFEPRELIYGITLRQGKPRELADLKLDLLKQDRKRLITGADQIEEIHQVVRADGRTHLPIHDYLLNIRSIHDLSKLDHEWLHNHFHYTNAPGGLRLRLDDQRAILIGFDGTGLDYDLFFALRIAKLYVHVISLAEAQYATGLSALKALPSARFWLQLSPN